MTIPETIGVVVGGATLLVSIAALGATVVRHMVTYAYDKGVNDNRLSAVEDATKGLPAALAALTSGVAAMQHTTERVDKALERLENRVFAREP